MPGNAAWEGDTRGSDLLVAESEPDHDDTPGSLHRRQGESARYLGVSYSGNVCGGLIGLGGRGGEVEHHGKATAL
jgi:hypothetical protein